jgi:hypothetical protein
MKRQILDSKRARDISGCCPGHDTYPVETYRGRLSKIARARDKKKEHRYIRRITKQNTTDNE